MSQTALHQAAREGDIDLVQLLVDGSDGYVRLVPCELCDVDAQY